MYQIIKQSKKSLARASEIETAHGKVKTPVFMPCATTGAVKAVSFEELKKIGYELILANTYHLYLRPGEKYIKKMGGLQKFINWHQPILTDSGGYQIFSLGKGDLVKSQNDGVIFRSHLDGSKNKFTPEKVLEIQKNLGSDIMMVLDECTEFPVDRKRAEESLKKTHQWAKKSVDHWQKIKGDSKQMLFGIIQGSVYQDLREKSLKYISSLPFDGIAVGGVSVGEGKENMYKVIKWMGPLLPKDKPHYLMGVGEPEDIIFAVKYGFDLFDCVLPTRLARHGTIWTTKDWQKFQKIDLKKSTNLQENEVMMKGCQCPACAGGYSRAYISYLIKEKEMLGLRLASLHNLYLYFQLMYNLRRDIL